MELPIAFEEKMKSLLGDEYNDYQQSLGEKSFHGLRVNTGKISVEDFLEISPFPLTPVPWTKNGFYYDEDAAVTKHPYYHAGLYYIQEPSAMIPASRLPVVPGDKVLDLCGAPGGKATELGARLAGQGLLAANDVSNSRAMGLLKNLELFGIPNLLVTSETPERLLQYFPEYFDKILVDAPCSGEGMFRKAPTMIKSWLERGPEYYIPLQRQILEAGVKMLKPGGMLLYSTCTFDSGEDEGVIEYICQKFPQMKSIPMEGCSGFTTGMTENTLRVYPHKVKGEGHFTALLQKGEEEPEQPLPLSKKSRDVPVPEELKTFLASVSKDFLQEGSFDYRGEKVYWLPGTLPSIKGLRFLRTGLYLGDWKKRRFEPSQALAMALSMDEYDNSISFFAEDERVIRYLKGETVELSSEHQDVRGWVLVCVDGYPLGWAKGMNQSLKNKYYPGWRLQ